MKTCGLLHLIIPHLLLNEDSQDPPGYVVVHDVLMLEQRQLLKLNPPFLQLTKMFHHQSHRPRMLLCKLLLKLPQLLYKQLIPLPPPLKQLYKLCIKSLHLTLTELQKLHNHLKQIVLLQFRMCSALIGTSWQDCGQNRNMIDVSKPFGVEKNMNVIWKVFKI